MFRLGMFRCCLLRYCLLERRGDLWLLCQGGVVAGVAEHLGDVFLGVVDGYVGYVAVGVKHGGVDGIDEAFVGGDVEMGVAVEDFLQPNLNIKPNFVI